jgi:hypothetical protein
MQWVQTMERIAAIFRKIATVPREKEESYVKLSPSTTASVAPYADIAPDGA